MRPDQARKAPEKILVLVLKSFILENFKYISIPNSMIELL